jgi:hypothetical protein
LKAKINSRMAKLAAFSLILSLIITLFLYKAVKNAAQPEPTKYIAYFDRDLAADTLLSGKEIIMKSTPLSLIPEGAIENKDIIKEKRLLTDVKKGEMVIDSKLTERGELRVDTDKMWTIGIDVKDISNFLGVQLKLGEYYGLVYKSKSETRIMNKVMIVGIVDATGKEIISSGSSVPKTINVAIGSMEEMLEISDAKLKGVFEIIKPPEDWVFKREKSEDESTINKKE